MKKTMQKSTLLYGVCIASNNVMEQRGRVRWMVREHPKFAEDTGWMVLSHIDTAEYLSRAENMRIVSFEQVIEMEPALIGIYGLPVGSDLQVVDDGPRVRIVETKTGRKLGGNELYIPGTEAVKEYRLAATRGYAGAQYVLGWMYEQGRGAGQDYAEAAKWYGLAGEQGNKKAQVALYNIGVMYEQGDGVEQDYAEAMKCYRLAADQGHEKAQYNLGVMNGQGRGGKHTLQRQGGEL